MRAFGNACVRAYLADGSSFVRKEATENYHDLIEAKKYQESGRTCEIPCETKTARGLSDMDE